MVNETNNKLGSRLYNHLDKQLNNQLGLQLNAQLFRELKPNKQPWVKLSGQLSAFGWQLETQIKSQLECKTN